MKLSELIAAYGDEQVQWQKLDDAATALNMSNGVTTITFGTNEPIDPKGTVKLGLIVWLDRQRVADLIAADKADRS